MRSATQKPTSKYGQADANGIYRWEGCFLWWPDQRLLVLSKLEMEAGGPRFRCPTEAIQMANYALLTTRFFEGEQGFYEREHWPRPFEVMKNRYDGDIGRKYTMSRLDFRVMLIA